jgi:hypothetical protein
MWNGNCLSFLLKWVHPLFLVGFVLLDLQVFCVVFCRSMFSFCPFSFGNCIVWPTLIYGFWLPLWYPQTIPNKIDMYAVVFIDMCNDLNPEVIVRFVDIGRNVDQQYLNFIFITIHCKKKVYISQSWMNIAKCKMSISEYSRKGMKASFLSFNLSLHIIMECLSCSFTAISFE